MTHQERRALILTAVVVGGTLVFLHSVSEIMLPFIVGFILAYLLNPLVVKLEKRGVPRMLASIMPVGAAVTVLLIGLGIGVPVLIDQLTSFVQRVPVYLMMLQHFVLPEKLGKVLAVDLNFNALIKPLSAFGSQGAEWTLNALQRTVSGVAWLVNLALLMLMTPVVAFYLLVDWPGLNEKLLKQMPKRWRGSLAEMMREIDHKLAAYLRGTLLVCLSMGTFYALGLSSVGYVSSLLTGQDVPGLELGWAIGAATGLMAFIPVIGATMGLLLMLGMALVQYQLVIWEPYVFIAALFFLGQFLEGYVMNPLLVGNRVGLHPVWVIFALLAGGTLAGITGMLLAVPTAVVVSTLLPHLLRQWRAAVD